MGLPESVGRWKEAAGALVQVDAKAGETGGSLAIVVKCLVASETLLVVAVQ